MLVSWDDKSLINHQISLPSDSAQPNSQRVPSVAIGQGQGVADGVARPNGQREETFLGAAPWHAVATFEPWREWPWDMEKSYRNPMEK